MVPFKSKSGSLPDGRTYFEHHIGNFVASEGEFVTNLQFTYDDALLVTNALQCLDDVQRLAIALYPWLETAWGSLTATAWTTMHTQTFVRHRWLRSAGKHRWVVGYCHSREKLVEVIHWAWTLPGRDSLLFVPVANIGIAPFVGVFADDREDDDSNEISLLGHYPTVASRGLEGRYLRVFSTESRQETLEACLAQR